MAFETQFSVQVCVEHASSAPSRKACRPVIASEKTVMLLPHAPVHRGQCPGVPSLPVPGEEPDVLEDSPVKADPASPRVPGVTVTSSGTGRGKEMVPTLSPYSSSESFLPSSLL